MKLSLNILNSFVAAVTALLFLIACTAETSQPLAKFKAEIAAKVEEKSDPLKAGENSILVTVLGSGTPIPTADQFGASILVQAGGQDLLFDCGRGCTTRLTQVNRRLITDVQNLFLTHLHSDHIVGIDDLWMNGWTQGRNDPLQVYGPTGTKRFFTHLKEAFSEDISIRLKKGLPATTDGIALTMTDMTEDQIVHEQDGVKVTAFLVDHKPVDPAFGYRIDYAGRSVVISGDTKPSENLVKNSLGADVVLHEVMSPAIVEYIRTNFTDEQFKSIVGIHTTAEQAANIFAEITPGLAVYYHTRITPKDRSSLLTVTAETYAGRVEVGNDLFQILIGDDIKTSTLE